MPVRKPKPTSPGRRFVMYPDFAEITRDEPERVEVATESPGPAYLVLSDTFDPGWSATLDGRPVPIRPAYLAFRAVGVSLSLSVVLYGYTFYNLAYILPTPPAHVGSNELIGLLVFSGMFGVSCS